MDVLVRFVDGLHFIRSGLKQSLGLRALRSGRAQATTFLRHRAGSAGVEFALIAPAFILLIFGLFAASVMTATVNGLEQMTAGAARSTVSGQSDTERGTLATTYVAANVGAYPYIDPRALILTTAGNATARTFTVTLSYDLSANQILILVRKLVPLMPAIITRKAVIVNGGS